MTTPLDCSNNKTYAPQSGSSFLLKDTTTQCKVASGTLFRSSQGSSWNLRSVDNLFHQTSQVLQIFPDTDRWSLVHPSCQLEQRSHLAPVSSSSKWWMSMCHLCPDPCWKLFEHSELVIRAGVPKRSGTPQLSAASPDACNSGVAICQLLLKRQGIKDANCDLQDLSSNWIPATCVSEEDLY